MNNKSMLFFIPFILLTQSSIPGDRKHITITDHNRVTQVAVHNIQKPATIKELQAIVRQAKEPISIVGGGYSQGGQTACPCGTVISMENLRAVKNLDVTNKRITVQAGITWSNIQQIIDRYNLSLRVMQSYNDFSVGGSLSVNVHGRFIADGPLVETVESLYIMLADGSLVTASRQENNELFNAAIGGYGACGIIVEATLSLTDNIKIEKRTARIELEDYVDYFRNTIANNPNVMLHNADLYPNQFDKAHCITWYKTDKPLTITDRLQKNNTIYAKEMLSEHCLRRIPFMKKARSLIEPMSAHNEVVWRNYEMSYTVQSLEPLTRLISINILQEYFIPVENLEKFIKQLRIIAQKNQINILNLSLRYVHKNTESILTYSAQDSFACVFYINIFNTHASRIHAQSWTRELIDAALSCNGTYYLPYQLFATPQQLRKAYPRFDEFLGIKKKYDPTNLFLNNFLKTYGN